MQHLETLLAHYGWEGTTLVALLLAMWFVQLRYYLFVYGPVASYRNNRRPTVREAEPPVSVVVPMFSEDYAFVEERLPAADPGPGVPRLRGGAGLRGLRRRLL